MGQKKKVWNLADYRAQMKFDQGTMLDQTILNMHSAIQSEIPEIMEYLSDSKIGTLPVKFMDKYYKTWKKREQKGKHVKFRHISAVKVWNLKKLHLNIDQYFRLPVASTVFSYRTGQSSATCAERHVGCFALYKLDIKDFFPSITRSDIESLYVTYFGKLQQYSKKISSRRMNELARMISIICTRSDTRKINTAEPVLPIGIVPASTISNYALYVYVKAMEKMALKHNLFFSRYSDNVFISSKKKHIDREIQEEVKRRLNEYTITGDTQPFKCNDSKERYSPTWRHQRVLGAVVNRKMNIPKRRESWLRSAMHHLYLDADALLDSLENNSIKPAMAKKKVADLVQRLRVIHGDMSYTNLVAPQKYEKYLSMHQTLRIMVDEAKEIVED